MEVKTEPDKNDNDGQFADIIDHNPDLVFSDLTQISWILWRFLSEEQKIQALTLIFTSLDFDDSDNEDEDFDEDEDDDEDDES